MEVNQPIDLMALKLAGAFKELAETQSELFKANQKNAELSSKVANLESQLAKNPDDKVMDKKTAD